MKRPDDIHYYDSKVTVQLKDGTTGKVVQESHGQNFVSNQAVRHAKWLLRNQYKSGLSAINATVNDNPPHSASSHIVLSDSVLAEDPANEWFMPGKLIGYAEKYTYAGSDVYLGTPNVSSLEATSEYTKWIWDWPTQSGIGTIGSVGWVNMTDVLAYNNYGAIYQTQSSTIEQIYPTASSWKAFAQANSNLSFGNTGNTVIYPLNSVYASGSPVSFNVSGQFTAVRGIAWDSGNNFLWVIGDNSSTRRIAAYNSLGVLQSGPFTTTTRDYKSLAHDGTKLWTTTLNSGASNQMWSISTSNGSDISNFQFDTLVGLYTTNGNNTYSSANNVVGLCWENSMQRLWVRTSNAVSYNCGAGALMAFDVNGNIQSVPISTASVWNPATGTYITLSHYTIFGDFDAIDGSQFAMPYSNNVYRVRGTGMGTRSLLLPSPVVKTNTQTLKVIYTINYV